MLSDTWLAYDRALGKCSAAVRWKFVLITSFLCWIAAASVAAHSEGQGESVPSGNSFFFCLYWKLQQSVINNRDCVERLIWTKVSVVPRSIEHMVKNRWLGFSNLVHEVLESLYIFKLVCFLLFFFGADFLLGKENK